MVRLRSLATNTKSPNVSTMRGSSGDRTAAPAVRSAATASATSALARRNGPDTTALITCAPCFQERLWHRPPSGLVVIAVQAELGQDLGDGLRGVELVGL